VRNLEPDSRNAAMARQNLAPSGDRATVIEAAVWLRDAPLEVRRGAFGDGREWSYQFCALANTAEGAADV
jgi:hypothetical protein